MALLHSKPSVAESKYELVQATEMDRPHTSHSPKWRHTLMTGMYAVVVVLILNFVTLVWSTTAFGEYGQGDPAKRQKQLLYGPRKLLINVLSTVLLAVSNNAAQILISATRAEVDQAHARQSWLNIGAPQSWRNFILISPLRKALFILLALSSLPLHYVYNSVIYLESAVNAYQVTAVTTGFLPPTYGDWSPDQINIGSALTADFNRKEWQESLEYMQHNTDQLTNLSNKDCILAYGSNLYQSNWGNVLLVTNATAGFEVVSQPVNHNYTVVMALENTPNDGAMTGVTMNWLCGDVLNEGGYTCSLSKALDESFSWHLRSAKSHHAGDSDNNPSEHSALVKYCLAEKRASPCSVQIASPFLTVVVLCNLVKLVCIVVMLYKMKNFQPLLSVGDAIASFLYDPDTSTVGCEVRRASRRTRWGSGASPFRRYIAIPIFLCPLAIGIYFFYAGVRATSLGPSGLHSATYEAKPMSWSSQGLSTAVTPYQLSLTTNGSVSQSLLLINLPQLIVTLVVLYYNHLITLILVGAEAAQFAVKRSGLRVSSPREDTAQRSTYWLQLPFRYVIPSLTLNSFMHWALGRSIFLIHFQVYGPLGTVIPENARTTAGYSPVGILIALVIGGVLLLALMVLGLKRMPEGAPVLGSCSLAISAACHAPEGDEKAAEKEVMYGVVNDFSQSQGGKPRLATFTSWDTHPA